MYSYEFYLGGEDFRIAVVPSDLPLPEIAVGNSLLLTVDGWSHRTDEQLHINKVRVSLSYLSGEIVRYRLEVFCELREYE